jgi:hypothetical protein
MRGIIFAGDASARFYPVTNVQVLSRFYLASCWHMGASTCCFTPKDVIECREDFKVACLKGFESNRGLNFKRRCWSDCKITNETNYGQYLKSLIRGLNA